MHAVTIPTATCPHHISAASMEPTPTHLASPATTMRHSPGMGSSGGMSPIASESGCHTAGAEIGQRKKASRPETRSPRPIAIRTSQPRMEACRSTYRRLLFSASNDAPSSISSPDDGSGTEYAIGAHAVSVASARSPLDGMYV